MPKAYVTSNTLRNKVNMNKTEYLFRARTYTLTHIHSLSYTRHKKFYMK